MFALSWEVGQSPETSGRLSTACVAGQESTGDGVQQPVLRALDYVLKMESTGRQNTHRNPNLNFSAGRTRL